MNLIEGLLSEMDRVREIVKEYESLPSNAGILAASFMKLDIKRAETCMANGDTIEMMLVYEKLKEYQN